MNEYNHGVTVEEEKRRKIFKGVLAVAILSAAMVEVFSNPWAVSQMVHGLVGIADAARQRGFKIDTNLYPASDSVLFAGSTPNTSQLGLKLGDKWFTVYNSKTDQWTVLQTFAPWEQPATVVKVGKTPPEVDRMTKLDY